MLMSRFFIVFMGFILVIDLAFNLSFSLLQSESHLNNRKDRHLAGIENSDYIVSLERSRQSELKGMDVKLTSMDLDNRQAASTKRDNVSYWNESIDLTNVKISSINAKYDSMRVAYIESRMASIEANNEYQADLKRADSPLGFAVILGVGIWMPIVAMMLAIFACVANKKPTQWACLVFSYVAQATSGIETYGTLQLLYGVDWFSIAFVITQGIANPLLYHQSFSVYASGIGIKELFQRITHGKTVDENIKKTVSRSKRKKPVVITEVDVEDEDQIDPDVSIARESTSLDEMMSEVAPSDNEAVDSAYFTNIGNTFPVNDAKKAKIWFEMMLLEAAVKNDLSSDFYNRMIQYVKDRCPSLQHNTVSNWKSRLFKKYGIGSDFNLMDLDSSSAVETSTRNRRILYPEFEKIEIEDEQRPKTAKVLNMTANG